MPDRSEQVAGVAITFFVLTWLAVGLRCYVRTIMIKAFGLDDKVMLLTSCFFTAYLACQFGGAMHGTGQHRQNVTDSNAQTALRYWFFCEVFYTISKSVLKIAIGLFFLRITIVPVHIWIIRIIMAVAAVVGTVYTLLVIFQCNPISYWWDLDPTHTGACLSASLVMDFTYVVSILNSLADWTFGLLPIFIVKDLQIKKRVKVVISTIIGLAAIGSTATLIRLPYTSTLKPYKGDFLHRTTDFAIWTTVEVGVGITAGCIATLRPLFKATLGSPSQDPGMQWSRMYKGGFRHKSSAFETQQALDDLRAVGEHTTRTTTVTCGRVSTSDEESFWDLEEEETRWQSGIRKDVTTIVTMETVA